MVDATKGSHPTTAPQVRTPGEPAFGDHHPPRLDLMRHVKAEFDPHNTLNPGRFMGGM